MLDTGSASLRDPRSHLGLESKRRSKHSRKNVHVTRKRDKCDPFQKMSNVKISGK